MANTIQIKRTDKEYSTITNKLKYGEPLDINGQYLALGTVDEKAVNNLKVFKAQSKALADKGVFYNAQNNLIDDAGNVIEIPYASEAELANYAKTADLTSGAIVVKKAESALSATNATNAQNATNATNATVATNADKVKLHKLSPAAEDPTKYYVCGTLDVNGNEGYSELNYFNNSTDTQVYLKGGKLFGAAWNDFAEFRKCEEKEPGKCVVEVGDGSLKLSEERLQPACSIISDTFGFAVGEANEENSPICVAGRVLAYPFENRELFKAGDAVCSGPNGTVSLMTREEIKEWPDRIVGYVSEIPAYENWHKVLVNSRIWIKLK